jgi:hypothetical protein
MAIRLSASHAGRPLSPGRFLVLISVRGWVNPRVIMRLEGFGQLKEIHLIGTRTRDLPDCSIGPQPTTLPRAQHEMDTNLYFNANSDFRIITIFFVTYPFTISKTDYEKCTALFRNVTPYGLVEIYRRFWGTYCLYTHARRVSQATNKQESSNIALLIIRPWWWSQYLLPKHLHISTRLHGAISQNIILFRVTAVRNLILKWVCYSQWGPLQIRFKYTSKTSIYFRPPPPKQEIIALSCHTPPPPTIQL